MILQSRFRLSVAVLFTVLIASAFVALSEEQSKGKWSAPAAEAQKKNPVAASESSLAAGRKIYSKTCAMCHGKSGDADGPAVIELNIHPAKLSDPKVATEDHNRQKTDADIRQTTLRNRSLEPGELRSDALEAITYFMLDPALACRSQAAGF